MDIMARGTGLRAAFVAFCVVTLVTAVALGGQVGLLDQLLVLAALALWGALGLAIEADRIVRDRSSVAIPGIVVLLPLFHVLFSSGRWEYLFQVGVVALLALQLSLLSPARRFAAVRRALPLLGPALLLATTVAASYAVSNSIGRSDLLELFNWVTGTAFVLLAALYCRSLQDLRRLLNIVIVGALVQVPIVLGQAAGLMDNLPGGLAQLSPTNWGGSVTGHLGSEAGGAIVTRYPGSFGSAENFAEYCGIMLILCLGLLLFEPRKPRIAFLGFAAAAISVMGWFTGTRSFVLGAAGGTAFLLLVALLVFGPRIARVWRLGTGLVLSTIVVLWLVPGEVTAGFLSRFRSPDFSLSGPNALDRLGMFKQWAALGRDMPLLGYGTRMHAVVRAANPVLAEWPHSLYFWAWLTSGALGLVAAVLVVALAIYLPVCTLKRRAAVGYRQLGLVFAAIAVYWAVSELKIEFVRLSFYVDFVFLLLGIIASLYVLAYDSSQSSDL